MIELAAHFVPAADEVYRLQTDMDPECVLFRRMARSTDEPSRGTMQGIYVLSPAGTRLGAINTLNADAVASMLEGALERWRELPPEQRRRTAAAAATVSRHRWEDSYPDGGLVLARTVRDLPVGFDPGGEVRPPFNRDAVWFTAAEARTLLPARPEVGAVHEVPKALVERLARFHVVDNVRGQTLPFAREEVLGSQLQSEVLAREGDLVSVRLIGEARSVSAGPWLLGDNYWRPERTWPHGVRARLLGRGRYDLATGRFSEFDLVAVGVRWGRTVNNGRRADLDPAPIGFLFEMAPVGWRVAPTFINVYEADWVVR